MIIRPHIDSLFHPSRFALGLLLGCLSPAQTPLQLDVLGGSTPGILQLDLHPALFPFEFGGIIPSVTRGPTPLSLVDPNDPRSLDIGSELFGAAWFGFFGANLHLTVGPLTMSSVPSMQDLPIYFQGVTLVGNPVVGRISNVDAIRLGIAGAFRDRGVAFADERAFATVLPREDRRWMVVGGARGSLLAQQAHDTTSIYDPITDTFASGPTMTTERSMHTQTRLNDGRYLLVGGVDAFNDPQAECEIYDPATDTFAAAATMNLPRMGHTATLLGDGRVLVTGGLQAMTTMPTQLSAIHDATDTAEIYDPVADAWTPAPNLSVPRAAHAAILRPDGKVLLCGGVSWDPVIFLGWLPTVRSSCDLYDPATNTMTSGPSMNSPRSFLEPVPLGGDRYLFAGGIAALTLTNPGTSTASAEIYDATTNAWTVVGSMASARAFHRSWSLGNGDFLLAGGAAGDILSPVPSAATEVFSTATNTFAPGPAMTVPRAAPALYQTPQGQIELFGGASTNNVITNSTEFYYF